MTQALSIGASAIEADTTAIDTISENVANAQTAGYVAESAQLAALPGADGAGSGVEVVGIAQATSALLSANNWQAQGELGNLGSLQQVLSSVESVFPLTTAATTPASSGSGISGQLATFWSSWDAIAQDPSSTAPRLEVIDNARVLAESLNEASTQLGQIAANATSELTADLAQVNTLLGQVADLNRSIVVTKSSGGSPAQLVDQLHAVLQTLAQLVGVSVRTGEAGTADLSIGGVTVVQGTTASSLRRETQAGSSVVVATPGSVTVPVSSGSVAGLLQSVNYYLPQYRSELDKVAETLVTTVNSQLKKGYFSTGAAASPATTPTTPSTYELFTGTSAADIALNPAVATHPERLAVSATPGAAAANNGANAQAMAAHATSLTGPDGEYQNLVQNMGADAQSVNNQFAAQTSVATQAQSALQAVTGVDVTAQLTDLLNFQNSYQAAAKVISVVDAAVQSLLGAVQ
jgi:flagellar hook-associated protein 1 FlgK